MIFQLFHSTDESGALYLVVIPRHAVVTTAMSYKKLPESQQRLPQAKQSTAYQIREISGLLTRSLNSYVIRKNERK